MDLITSSQLEKYNHILDEIKKEQETTEKLKKEIDKETDQILISKLNTNPNYKEKLALTNVKIFNNIYELYTIYEHEINANTFANLSKIDGNYKYYLLEVFFTDVLEEKIKNQNWCLSFYLKCPGKVISKSLTIKNKFPILEVLPVENDIYDSKLEVLLSTNPESDSNLVVLNLDPVDIDISYHFSTIKDRSLNSSKQFIQIANIYNPEENLTERFSKKMYLEYRFKAHPTREDFISSFIKNSYHQLDIELFSALNNENITNFTIPFSVDGVLKCYLNFDEQQSIISIKSHPKDLPRLKKYFLKEFWKCEENSASHSNVVKKIQTISTKQQHKILTSEDLNNLHKEVRSMWQEL